MTRNSWSASDDTDRTCPVPPQVWHLSVELSSTLVRMRWRDISIRPKCEMRPTWMRARSFLSASLSRRSTERLLRFSSMSMKSITTSPGEIAKPQLPCNFLGRFEVGLERGVLDVMFARGATGVHVDRNQRFGLVEHDVTAGAQLHDRREHRVELALDRVAREHRLRIAIELSRSSHGSA